MGLIPLQTTPLQGPPLLYMGWKEDRCRGRGCHLHLIRWFAPSCHTSPRLIGGGATCRRGVDVLRGFIYSAADPYYSKRVHELLNFVSASGAQPTPRSERLIHVQPRLPYHLPIAPPPYYSHLPIATPLTSLLHPPPHCPTNLPTAPTSPSPRYPHLPTTPPPVPPLTTTPPLPLPTTFPACRTM